MLKCYFRCTVVQWNILLQFISPVSFTFLNVAAWKFKITCVAHPLFLVVRVASQGRFLIVTECTDNVKYWNDLLILLNIKFSRGDVLFWKEKIALKWNHSILPLSTVSTEQKRWGKRCKSSSDWWGTKKNEGINQTSDGVFRKASFTWESFRLEVIHSGSFGKNCPPYIIWYFRGGPPLGQCWRAGLLCFVFYISSYIYWCSLLLCVDSNYCLMSVRLSLKDSFQRVL